MKQYKMTMQEEQVLSQIVCNGCGREIPLEQSDYFHGEKTWGYFSAQDGRRDDFDLCEDCYRKLTNSFAVKMNEE